MNKPSDTTSSPFVYRTVKELVEACVSFYHGRLEKSADALRVCHRREQLAGWVRKFHEECGTLNPQVEKSLDNFGSGQCILLMTAHQPNLFAYGGVLRKATLNQVLAEKLCERLNVPVISLFGLADQDFTDDRWVREALLPDVERRDGVVELRIDLPEKVVLNKVAKPSRKILDNWKNEITTWLDRNFSSVQRSFNSLRLNFEAEKSPLIKNLGDFWGMVEDAYAKAATYSDFNAFTMSKIVNEAWGYSTLFARFSECQQIFEREFCMILSSFDEYSRSLKEVTQSNGDSKGGVYEQEYETIPFWYHCDCGSKARLMAVKQGEDLAGQGACVRCAREYHFDFCSKNGPNISGSLPRISARSLAMPLVFFGGLGVDCYVGGVGGKEYLEQAKFVAERMGTIFPPVVVWRPKDNYLGIGQLGAILTFRNLAGTFDISKHASFRAILEERISRVQREIEAVEVQKKQLVIDAGVERDELVEKMKALAAKQDRIRRESDFPMLVRDLKLFENVQAVMNLHPCIIDYAVNIGLERTSEQWMSFLKEGGSLCSDISLKTSLGKVAPFD